jgi:hypothetical protein
MRPSAVPSPRITQRTAIKKEFDVTLAEFLATDAVNVDDYNAHVEAWVSTLTQDEHFTVQDELVELFRLELEGQPYTGDHDLDLIFISL